MLFHTPTFVLFFAAVLGSFYAIPFRYGKILLLAASYAFYAAWNPKFLPLLLALTLTDYYAGRFLETNPSRLVLAAGIAANLAFLGFFKYFNFAAVQLGYPPADIVLPLGISFHTFQSISYLIDVHRRQHPAVRSLPDYALFIAFFPQLVAGPIVRAREFFAGLHHWTAPNRAAVEQSAMRFLAGLTKKMLFADRFAQVADPYFASPITWPGLIPAWTATLAFSLQIYFDFSGYTDMAIGLAGLLGFHFPENFQRPYLSGSLAEFWQRWHISLSRWLRDYLYIPLGGNRLGSARTYLNLVVTMLLGGLWHGASWNFIIWGAYHGLLLATERATNFRLRRAIGIPLTFTLVAIGWVPFRSPGLATTFYVLTQMFQPNPGVSPLTPGLLILTALALGSQFAPKPNRFHFLLVSAIFLVLEYFAVTGEDRPFLYFQF